MAFLVLVPLLPLLGSALLILSEGRLPPRLVALVGVGSVALSAVIATWLAIAFLTGPDQHVTLTLWQWVRIGAFAPTVSLYLDPLSLVMMLVVTIIGSLILLYAVDFMAGDEGYSRFFAYMDLFVAAMLLLVLAGDLLALYVGWEGVGLCSYLLIGFWYQDPANGLAARKAFIVTRIGDTGFMLGLFLIFTQLHTLQIQPVLAQAQTSWHVGSLAATLAAALLLTGAIGKSAQVPLQTWLPDAMAGPTPVSALIHAATMVTAGVYLIARTHTLFALAPVVLAAVGVIGTITLLIAAFAALNQSDIKRILAYSTISQIGYMFLALGVGAWSAAVFHLMVHAFFKALLFLAAGAITMRLHHEHNIFRMGGLAKRLPLAFWSFLIGSASLAALPLITAGFYSKDAILSAAWAQGGGALLLWLGGIVTAFVTALYIFRAVFIVFFGPAKTEPSGRYSWRVAVPLTLLSVLALIGGLVETPPALGGITLFSRLLAPVFPNAPPPAPVALILFTAFISLLGLGLAYALYWQIGPRFIAWSNSPAIAAWRRFFAEGWAFDALYHRLVVAPFLALVRANRGDFIDQFYTGIAWTCRWLHQRLGALQTGRIRWYASWIAAGSVVTIAVAVLR
ncbi:MAG TPA: NADH-quinone oxidoreductase subunit L [Acidocella sp.]|jgi:NADH-quinone oxidoreductase subunit L|uniref:NADH-quinone oxidoreductase subunit L n=1 Tax=Acidocella sp. TaxID=50710 RepID=UPI002C026A85|nr:NADH-quinone oxidoreductase subunit L [Acidocella sp.]HVE22412.1 NADH-quinone oxidoreductase subunit L [Acidocella sp.]